MMDKDLFEDLIESVEQAVAIKESERQAQALLQMALMANADVAAGRTMGVEEALAKLKGTIVKYDEPTTPVASDDWENE